MHKKLYLALILIISSSVLIAAVAWLSLQTIIPVRELRFDFYPRWVGAQAFWQGDSPYSPEVTAKIQQGMFGDILPPEYDQQNSAYPAYSYVLLAPVTLLPAPLAIAVWMAVQIVAVFWAILMWIYALNWRPPGWIVGVLFISLVLVFRHPVNTFVLAQFTGTMLLLQVAAFYLLLNKRDLWAGTLLAFSTVPPTISAPLACTILVIFAARGRWQGIAAFVATLSVLTLISIIQIGWWIDSFLAILKAYTQYSHPVWAPNLIANPIFRAIFIALVIGTIVWFAVRYWRSVANRQAIDVIITVMIGSLILLPQTGSYYLVLLIPPLLTCFYRASTIPSRWLFWFASGLAIVSPWFYNSLPGGLPVEALLLPLHVGLIWLSIYLLTRANPEPSFQ